MDMDEVNDVSQIPRPLKGFYEFTGGAIALCEHQGMWYTFWIKQDGGIRMWDERATKKAGWKQFTNEVRAAIARGDL